MQPTPLIESEEMAGTSGSGASVTSTTATGQGPGFEVALGGAESEPAVRFGGVTLGYQDILLLVLFVQTVAAGAAYVAARRGT